MAKKWIYRVEELTREDNEKVGKKCANLGEMTSLGMKVPPGFAISVDGYEKFMKLTGLGKRISAFFSAQGESLGKDMAAQLEVSLAAREMIRETEMPASMADEIVSHYRGLCERCGTKELSVAVRSSGAVSMPGQMETFLNVRGEQEVVSTVIDVWESTFNTRAIAFRLEKGLPVEKAPIGVAVIKMVNAKSAGVALTVIPTTGDLGKVVIEGNWGLGESVVSGAVTPDSFTVDKKSLSIEKEINRKTLQVTFGGNGTVESEVPSYMQEAPCLGDSEILEIVRIAKNVETHFGVPQDLEWVVDNSLPFPDNVFWVQARPAKYSSQKQEADIEYLLDQMVRLIRVR